MKAIINNSIDRLDGYIDRLSRIHPFYKILIITFFIIVIFFPGIKEYLEAIFSPHVFYDDERQYLPPFQKYLPTPIPSDYIKDYYLNVTMPWGFKALLKFVFANCDIQLALGVIKLTTMLATILVLGMVAWEIGGAWTLFCVITVFLSSPIFNFQAMAGVTPRMFIYFFIMLALLGIIKRNIWLIFLACVIPTLIYPQTTVITGTMMAIWLLFLPENNPLSLNNLSIKSKISLLTLTSLICASLVIPQLIHGFAYGNKLTETDMLHYPEIGLYGRYGQSDSYPYQFFFVDFLTTIARMLPDEIITLLGSTFSTIVFITLYLGILCLIGSKIKNIYTENPKITSIFILAGATVITHTFAYIVSPYLYIPSRYIHFPLPIIMLFLMPLAIQKEIGLFFRKNLSIALSVLIICACGIGFNSSLGGGFYSGIKLSEVTEDSYNVSSNKRVGVKNRSSFIGYYKSELELKEFIEKLPDNIIIAGWPSGLVNDVPLLAHRTALLTFETHQVFFDGYVKEMRRRFYTILDTYFSDSITPLIKLRDEFGVTHFLIEKRYLTGEDNLTYFKPFDADIEEKLSNFDLKNSFLGSSSLNKAAIFENEDVKIIDLSKL